MLIMKATIVGSVLAFLLLTGVVRAELIVNGGFEAPEVASAEGWAGYSSGSTGITNWTVGSAEGGAQVFTNSLMGGLNAVLQNGTQVLQVGGNGGSGLGSISQTLSTTAGQSYRISFDGGYRDDNSTFAIVVTFGDTQKTFSGSISAWERFSFTAMASGDSTALTLANQGTPGEGYPPRYLVDNVSVTTIPEPSAYIMIVSALCGLLAYAWRKRK